MVKIDESNMQKALKWLEEKWPKSKRTCEICSAVQWTISEDLVTPIVIAKDNSLALGGNSYPQCMVICNNCGNTKYFNAVIMKIFPASSKKEEPKNG